MAGGAQLSVPDMRRAARHPVDFPVIAEHRDRGDVPLHVTNFSAQGFNKVMLETGPAPLSILTAQLDSWSGGRLAKQQKKDKTAAAFSSLTSKAA